MSKQEKTFEERFDEEFFEIEEEYPNTIKQIKSFFHSEVDRIRKEEYNRGYEDGKKESMANLGERVGGKTSRRNAGLQKEVAEGKSR